MLPRCAILILAVLATGRPTDTHAADARSDSLFNADTGSRSRLSFTPLYKSLYDIRLFRMGDDGACERGASDEGTVMVPARSYMRRTLDPQGNSSTRELVHVYQVPRGARIGDAEPLSDEEARETYFSRPLLLCLQGAGRVSRSLYRRVGGVNTGLLVVPFKLRDGNVYTDSTIGPYVAYRWEIIEVLATAGLSQISISQVGTEDIETRTGLTVAAGVNFALDENWDIAFLVGADHLSGTDGATWEYQDKIWLSFAIGFNFTR